MPLYKATKTIAVFKFTPLKTSISKPLYIEGLLSFKFQGVKNHMVMAFIFRGQKFVAS